MIKKQIAETALNSCVPPTTSQCTSGDFGTGANQIQRLVYSLEWASGGRGREYGGNCREMDAILCHACVMQRGSQNKRRKLNSELPDNLQCYLPCSCENTSYWKAISAFYTGSHTHGWSFDSFELLCFKCSNVTPSQGGAFNPQIQCFLIVIFESRLCRGRIKPSVGAALVFIAATLPVQERRQSMCSPRCLCALIWWSLRVPSEYTDTFWLDIFVDNSMTVVLTV